MQLIMVVVMVAVGQFFCKYYILPLEYQFATGEKKRERKKKREIFACFDICSVLSRFHSNVGAINNHAWCRNGNEGVFFCTHAAQAPCACHGN